MTEFNGQCVNASKILDLDGEDKRVLLVSLFLRLSQRWPETSKRKWKGQERKKDWEGKILRKNSKKKK